MSNGLENIIVLRAEGYVTGAELATELQCQPATLRTWVYQGRFPPPHLKIGKLNMWVREKALAEYKSMMINMGAHKVAKANANRVGAQRRRNAS